MKKREKMKKSGQKRKESSRTVENGCREADVRFCRSSTGLLTVQGLKLLLWVGLLLLSPPSPLVKVKHALLPELTPPPSAHFPLPLLFVGGRDLEAEESRQTATHTTSKRRLDKKRKIDRGRGQSTLSGGLALKSHQPKSDQRVSLAFISIGLLISFFAKR